MTINSLEKISINHTEQWVLVRGANMNAPLILHVQAGPGLPMIPEANAMNKLLHLEEDYLVAYWDQRACGKSFDPNANPQSITFAQLADDIVACTKYLLGKYKKDKVMIIGYSIGATLSLMAAAKDSSLFSCLFLAGIDIDIPTANKYALEFGISKAKNNQKLLKQLTDLGKAPITTAKLFQLRAKILTDLGGIKMGSGYNQLLMSTIANMLFSKAYRLSDIPKTIQGMEFCQNSLLPELNTLNLFEQVKAVDVPVHFIQGRHDGVAPYQTAVHYYEYLQATKKTFTSFENSAHLPHYDEPEKFAALLKQTAVAGN